MAPFPKKCFVKPALAGASILFSLTGCVAYDGGGYGYTSAYDAYPYAYYNGGHGYYPRAHDYHRGYNWGVFHSAPRDHVAHASSVVHENHEFHGGHAGPVRGHR